MPRRRVGPVRRPRAERTPQRRAANAVSDGTAPVDAASVDASVQDVGVDEGGPVGRWVVRRITGSSSTKPYRCPGCDHLIRPATPHVVVWPAVSSLAAADGLSERRHWHTGCWQVRLRRGR